MSHRIAFAACLAAAVIARPAAAATCSSLSGLSLPHVTITTAEPLAGTFTPPGGAAIPNLPAFCRVAGFSSPGPDSQIGFEVWMPNVWNHRYQQEGNGGFAGAIPYGSL